MGDMGYFTVTYDLRVLFFYIECDEHFSVFQHVLINNRKKFKNI